MSSTTEARTFKGQRGKSTGRRPTRSRTKAPCMRERECAEERDEKRPQGAGPRVPGRKQDRRTDLVSKAAGRRPTRSRKATSSFSQARDLLRLFGASNFRVPNGSRYHIVIQAHGARVTWSTSDRGPRTPDRSHPYTTLDHNSADDETIITSNDNLQKHLLRGEAQKRPQRRCTTCSSQGMSEHTWTEYRPTRCTTRGTTPKLRSGRQCGRGRPSMNEVKKDNREQTHETQDGSKIVARTS